MPSKIRQTTTQGEIPESSFKHSPLEQVRVVYAGFCQGLFAAAPVGTYHWSPSNEETEILITDESPIQLDVVGMRPAISFTRGPVQSYSLGQDDLLSYNMATGKKTKSVLVPGSMSINCCSRNDLESEKIAWIVAEQLWLHREMLMRAGFFEIGRQFVVGSPSAAGSIVSGDSSDEWVCTTVSSPFQFYRTSTFTPLGSHVVAGIEAQFALHPMAVSPKGPTSGYNIGQTADGRPPHVLPHPLNPSQQVTIRSANPFRPGLRQPSIGGRTIPIQRIPVEESGPCLTTVIDGTKVD